MEKGWIKLYRRTLENSFLMHDANAYLVFTKLLLLVGQDKGQWSGGRRQLAEVFEMNDRTLYGVLIRLEDNGMIKIESQVRYSIISIVNWHLYQNKPNGGEKRRATDRSTLGKQMTIEESQQTLQPQRNHSATTAQHSIKKKKENKKIISTNVEMAKPVYGNPEINFLFESWQRIVGYPIESKRQLNRNACSNLMKKYTLDGVVKLINGVAEAQSNRYGPRISDFAELQSKTNELMAWGKKKIVGNAEEKGIVL